MHTTTERILFDLVAADGRPFSPNVWRTKMALAHKGLAWGARPTRFCDIAAIGDGHKTVPVLDDGDTRVADSWQIALHLEARYPDRPSLFGGDPGRALAWFTQQWVAASVQGAMFRLIVADIHDLLDPADQPYFRANREQRLGGRSLESTRDERDALLPAFRAGLGPLRATLESQPFLAGDRPMYPDYLAFGAFQWARMTSPYRLLADDDRIHGWLGRCLDLFDGLGRRVPAFW